LFSNIKSLKYFYRKLIKPDKVYHKGIKLDISSKVISHWVRDAVYKGFYEYHELTLLKKHLNASDSVLEIGGGIGLIGSACNVKNLVIYEANPHLIKIIEKNLHINDVKGKVVNKAIVRNNTKKKINFYIGPDFWNASLVKKDDFVRTPVNTEQFDNVIISTNSNFVIIDVEGYEYTLLDNYNFPKFVNKILIETHPKIIGQNKINYIIKNIINQKFHLIDKRSDVLLFQK
jgi:FkbM family methyltransferase